MSNPHGSFIWYELMSSDPDASKEIYDDVVGWNIGPKPVGDMDYRMIAAPLRQCRWRPAPDRRSCASTAPGPSGSRTSASTMWMPS